jgi:hypothetical protein
MTKREQDLLADAIKTTVGYDGGLKHLNDQDSRGSRLRAVSRLTQSIADKLGYASPPIRFDRARFVERTGFSSLEGF